MPTAAKWTIATLLLLATIIIPALLIPESVLTVSGDLFTESSDWLFFAAITAMLALDIFLPVPSSVLSTAAGATLGVPAGVFASWLGMTIGCIAGYGMGLLAKQTLLNKVLSPKELAQAERLSVRFGFYFILLARPVPVLAELCVFYSGAMRLRFLPFLGLVALSNLVLSVIYALVGDYTITTGSFLLACLAMFTIPALGLLVASRLGSVRNYAYRDQF